MSADRGVSSSTGTILMLAIAVVLAGVLLAVVIPNSSLREPETAGVTYTETPAGLQVELVSTDTEVVVVDAPNSSDKELEDVGDTVMVDGERGDEVQIIAKDGLNENLIGDYEIENPTTGTSEVGTPTTDTLSQPVDVASHRWIKRVNPDGTTAWTYRHPEYDGEPLFPANGCYGGSYFFGCYWFDADTGPSGDVYAVDHEPGELVRINGNDGSEQYFTDFGNYYVFTSVEATSDDVFVGTAATNNAVLMRVDKSTGAQETFYVYNTPDNESSWTTYVQDIDEGPDGDLYFVARHGIGGGNSNMTVVKASASDGTPEWKRSFVDESDSAGAMSITTDENGDAYVVNNNRILKLDSSSGSTVWNVDDTSEKTGVDVTNGSVYVADQSSDQVRKFAASDGAEDTTNWPQPYAGNDGFDAGDCIETDTASGHVLTGGDNTLHHSLGNGSQVWAYNTGASDLTWSGCSVGD